jgi:ABC-2 type transport system permease protein
MRNVWKLGKQELTECVSNPAILVLVLLPVFMSKIIIGVMNMAEQELMLLPSWILFAQVMVGIMLTGPNLLEERTAKTIDALLVTPLSYREVIAGKGIAITALSLVSQLLVVAVNGAVTTVTVPIMAILLLGSVLFMNAGFIVGMIMNSIKSGTAVSSVLMVVCFLIGTIYPALPDWKSAFVILPSVQIVEILQRLMQGNGLLGLETVLLIAWTAALTGIVVWRARTP